MRAIAKVDIEAAGGLLAVLRKGKISLKSPEPNKGDQ